VKLLKRFLDLVLTFMIVVLLMVFLIFSWPLVILTSMFSKDEMNNYDYDDYPYNFNHLFWP